MKHFALKICPICKTEFLPVNNVQKFCKGCVVQARKDADMARHLLHRERYLLYQKQYRQDHPVQARERSERFLSVRRDLVNNYKAERGCMICGEKDPCCLDFHHRVPADKMACIATMIRGSYAIQEILIEMGKCDVLCRNCHQKLHHYSKTQGSKNGGRPPKG